MKDYSEALSHIKTLSGYAKTAPTKERDCAYPAGLYYYSKKWYWNQPPDFKAGKCKNGINNWYSSGYQVPHFESKKTGLCMCTAVSTSYTVTVGKSKQSVPVMDLSPADFDWGKQQVDKKEV